MDGKPKTITGPFGRFIRQENGLIYFYKADGISVDKPTATRFLEIVRTLDDSGCAKIIVIQGNQVDYSFDAQQLLLTNHILGGIAYVTHTRAQLLSAEVLQGLSKTLRSSYQVRVFQQIEDAEDWLLTHSICRCPI